MCDIKDCDVIILFSMVQTIKVMFNHWNDASYHSTYFEHSLI